MSEQLTRNDVPHVHSVLVLDEAEAIRELDFGDFASASLSEGLKRCLLKREVNMQRD